MTSRERVTAAFAHREPDRTPIFEYVLLPPVAEQVLGRPFVEYLGGMEPWLAAGAGGRLRAGPARATPATGWRSPRRLGHDMICVSPNPVPGAAYSYDPLSEIGAQFAVRAEGDPVERLRARNRQVAETMLGDAAAGQLPRLRPRARGDAAAGPRPAHPRPRLLPRHLDRQRPDAGHGPGARGRPASTSAWRPRGPWRPSTTTPGSASTASGSAGISPACAC